MPLPIDELLPILDRIAASVAVLEGAFGLDGLGEGTISKAAFDDAYALADSDDPDVVADLMPAFQTRAQMLFASKQYGVMQGAILARALDRHYGSSPGSLAAFLEAEDARVHPDLRKIGFLLDARNVFSPAAVDPVALYEGDGAGTGTFTAGSDIDRSAYFAAAMEIVVDAMGADARTLKLTMKTFDGGEQEIEIEIPANAVAGSTVAIGNPATDLFQGVAGIETVSGGTAGDEVHVRSIVEREIAL